MFGKQFPRARQNPGSIRYGEEEEGVKKITEGEDNQKKKSDEMDSSKFLTAWAGFPLLPHVRLCVLYTWEKDVTCW